MLMLDSLPWAASGTRQLAHLAPPPPLLVVVFETPSPTLPARGREKQGYRDPLPDPPRKGEGEAGLSRPPPQPSPQGGGRASCSLGDVGRQINQLLGHGHRPAIP